MPRYSLPVLLTCGSQFNWQANITGELHRPEVTYTIERTAIAQYLKSQFIRDGRGKMGKIAHVDLWIRMQGNVARPLPWGILEIGANW